MVKFIAYTALALVAFFFIAMHFHMDHKVGHWEGEFVNLVEHPKYWPGVEDFPQVMADRDKRLNRLVALRDSAAHANGYRVLGGWEVKEGYYPETFCVYVYTFGL